MSAVDAAPRAGNCDATVMQSFTLVVEVWKFVENSVSVVLGGSGGWGRGRTHTQKKLCVLAVKIINGVLFYLLTFPAQKTQCCHADIVNIHQREVNT